MTVRLLLLALAAVRAPRAAAQAPSTPPAIPVFKVAPPEATTKEPIGRLAGLKQFADGRLLVNDAAKRRLIVLDPTLTTFTVTADTTGTGAPPYPSRLGVTGIFEYPGDSVMVPDAMNTGAGSFIMVAPSGTFGRTVAHPKPPDMAMIMVFPAGSSGFDQRGRFVYRARTINPPRPKPGDPPAPAKTADTAAIVRADFDTRTVDTIGHLLLPYFPPVSPVKWDDNGHASAHETVNPVPSAADDWAVLSDGSVAIVRAHDYHIDWVYADGTQASTPKMAFDWRRLTDEDKQAKIDSVKHLIDSLKNAGHPYGPIYASRNRGKTDTVIPTLDFAKYSEMLDYVPPIRAGYVKPDRDGHLWIVPTTTRYATGGGLLYDVIDKKGEVFERVQLPPNRVIAGFGPGGAIYLMYGDRTNGFTLERTRVLR